MTAMKLPWKTKYIDPHNGGSVEMLTPKATLVAKGSTLSLPHYEKIMENIVWVNQDGTQEFWLCNQGTLKGILRNNIELESLWDYVMVKNVDHQHYWPELPLERQNRME